MALKRSINRIRLEFKSQNPFAETGKTSRVLIESDWNLNYEKFHKEIKESVY